MFKELKILKLSLSAIFLMVIIWNVSESYNFSVFYTAHPSHNLSNEIIIYHAGNYASKAEKLVIKNLVGEIVFEQPFNSENNLTEYENISDFPQSNSLKTVLPDSCRSGIYSINDKYSLVVKSAVNSDITVVYPYVNNRIYQKTGEETLLSEKIVAFDVLQPVELDNHTRGLSNFFNYCNQNYSVIYISDLDLEKFELYSNSKLLIIYGNSAFYTSKMKEGIINFVKKGGNILLMSSNFCSNVIWHENNKISFVENSANAKFSITSWLKLNKDLRRDFGLSYMYGGEALTIKGQSYYVVKKHEIFDDLNSNTIPIEADKFIGEYSDWSKDSIPYAKQLFFYSNQLLAYNLCKFEDKRNNIGGIYLTQPDSTSGSVLSLGTEDWCLEKNQQKPEIWNISVNAVTFLMK